MDEYYETIKRLHQENKELRAENEALKARITRMIKKYNELKNSTNFDVDILSKLMGMR